MPARNEGPRGGSCNRELPRCYLMSTSSTDELRRSLRTRTSPYRVSRKFALKALRRTAVLPVLFVALFVFAPILVLLIVGHCGACEGLSLCIELLVGDAFGPAQVSPAQVCSAQVCSG